MKPLYTTLPTTAALATCAARLAPIWTPLFNAMVTAQSAFETIAADKAATERGQALPSIAAHRPILVRQVNLLLAALEEWHEVASTPALEAVIMS